MEMEREMRLLQGIEGVIGRKPTAEMHGVAKWVFGTWRGWCEQREVQHKQLQLMETLALGGKRQLMLVSCGGERFLVGGGPESVETIVHVKAERSLGFAAKNPDEICL
jgi:hypothetical protein